ncbi:hypothetical protein BC938DRAFT_476506 [Jimgerdemannia flammicorona]|uniref:Uncharacterized protein n=1 Tax=Jimgerdemannia flammicorona TaxID=994334 RepID=A0A433PGL2_9FUNG|nr:hypothetical protein BC938DRAFT_476506 [Jimgerdemannia flammicorona]
MIQYSIFRRSLRRQAGGEVVTIDLAPLSKFMARHQGQTLKIVDRQDWIDTRDPQRLYRHFYRHFEMARYLGQNSKRGWIDTPQN